MQAPPLLLGRGGVWRVKTPGSKKPLQHPLSFYPGHTETGQHHAQIPQSHVENHHQFLMGSLSPPPQQVGSLSRTGHRLNLTFNLIEPYPAFSRGLLFDWAKLPAGSPHRLSQKVFQAQVRAQLGLFLRSPASLECSLLLPCPPPQRGAPRPTHRTG